MDATQNGKLTIFPKVDYKRITLAPKSVETHVTLNTRGEIAYENGHLNNAITYFQKAFSAAPEYPVPLLNLAKVYRQKNDMKMALQYATKALRLSGTCKQTVLVCADLLLKSGNEAPAKKICENYLSQTGENDEDVRRMLNKAELWI